MTTVNDIEFIIPCAGLSTRNYPQSKGIPHKALLPFGSYRLIDHILKDIIIAGGKHITIVVSNKECEMFFREALACDKHIQEKLIKRDMAKTVDLIKSVAMPDDIEVKYVIQEKAMGTAQCVALAYKPENDRHAVMIYPDNVYLSADKANPHMKKFVVKFLQDTKKALVAGLVREDVSNNCIIQDGRFVEKPKNPTTNVGGVSPIAIPKEICKHMHDKMPSLDFGNGEWFYNEEINCFLDNHNENGEFSIDMPVKDEEDGYIEITDREVYEEALLYSLLHNSIDKEKHIEKIKEFVHNL